MSKPPNRTSYDDLPYPSHPYPYTHPDHVATVATLLGMHPAPADQCRVLELGCAGGGNLIPLALVYPHSSFIGIDLSGAQIAEGQKTVDALGLKNIQLRHLSILDVDDRFGLFDFIICHGVYSWVPGHVQDKILEICAHHLTENGVGLISYNTYPGWHMRGMIRAMMGHHDRRFEGEAPMTRVGRARALLNFLVKSVQEDTPYSLLLRENLEVLKQCSDSYLFHEHLEECNEPVYFFDFCERMAFKGLRYLGDSDFRTMVASTSFPAEVQQQLREVAPNLLEMEQYMDFLRNRMFRQTLVCHDHICPNYYVRGEQLASLSVASPLRPTSERPKIHADAAEEFKGFNNAVLTTSIPIVKAALLRLGEVWPRAVAFPTLLAEAQGRLMSAIPDHPAGSLEDRQELCKALLTAYASGGHSLVELSLRPPAFAVEVSDRPTASPLARLQATSTSLVTNLRHATVPLNDFDRQLVPLLDGTRDREALELALFERFEKGALRFSKQEVPVTDLGEAREILHQVLDTQLSKLAKAAVLLR